MKHCRLKRRSDHGIWGTQRQDGDQMTGKQPYADTKVPAEKSRMEIERLLRKYNAQGVRWTRMGSDPPVLEFIFNVTVKGVQKQLGFRIVPPIINVRKRKEGKWGDIITVRNEDAEMRLVWWFVKSRLEAVAAGMETLEEALMSKILVALPDEAGRTQITTIGEEIKKQIADPKRKGLLPTFRIEGEALPEGD